VTLFVSVVYHAILPDASVLNYPDVVFLLISMYLCLALSVWLLFALIHHLVTVSLGVVQVSASPDCLAGCRRTINTIFAINFLILIIFATVGLAVGVVLPVAARDDPVRQNLYFTIFFCMFCATMIVQGGLYAFAIRHVLYAIEKHVQRVANRRRKSGADSNVEGGMGDNTTPSMDQAWSSAIISYMNCVVVSGESDSSHSISRAPNGDGSMSIFSLCRVARSFPETAMYADIIVRLWYHLVVVIGVCISEAVLFSVAAIYGER